MTLREALADVGLSLRRPEALAQQWRDGDPRGLRLLILVFLANASFGVAAYGVTMQLHAGWVDMFRNALFTPLAAGGAWIIALPAFYVFNRAFGSRLDLSTTLLAASITVCFGGWAMLASVPVNWFFTLALPFTEARVAVNLVVFAGVGVCMTDVFIRVLRSLEPKRGIFLGYAWLGLLGVIGLELFVLLDVFSF